MEQVVRTILFNEKKEILLVKHSEKTLWALPGGHIEKGENMYQALHREIMEEFNLQINIPLEVAGLKDSRVNIEEFPKPISIYKITFGDREKMEYIFLAKIISGKMRVDKNEIFEYKFFKKGDILNQRKEIYSQIVDLVEKYVN
ncbi:hypothetical protein CSA08_04510 [Candidatus Gracilibacteria bacterium]|nr:MAG: hypothetical protein CSA08_04510 [Candidatus Gracilibacteria bacterium]